MSRGLGKIERRILREALPEQPGFPPWTFPMEWLPLQLLMERAEAEGKIGSGIGPFRVSVRRAIRSLESKGLIERAFRYQEGRLVQGVMLTMEGLSACLAIVERGEAS